MAAIINVSEADFTTLALAAQCAKDRGDVVEAQALDKLARKANAALSNAKYHGMAKAAGIPHKPIKWTGVPSTLI